MPHPSWALARRNGSRHETTLDRSVQLVSRGPETLRLRGLAFRTSGLIAAETGFYRFPATWPPRSHRFAEMQPGRKAYSRGTIATALAELSPSQSLLWASFTEDTPGLEVTEDRGRFDVRQTVAACGYLRPNEAQDFGAAHYLTNFDLDGFRVDACGGSREPNWSTSIPYARASLAMMQGGLEMMKGIRAEVRRANPRHGAVLAEVESARQAAISDVQYDFTFCYTLCRSWNRMEAGPFVNAPQDYLEEQRLSEPRGVVRLRHVESHDSLRGQGWYGVQGLRAMYALSAWIDGMPIIYQGMEDGHAFALAEINHVRRERPELSRGEAFYRAVRCDVPGVFTCLRKLGERASVVVINFNRKPVLANLDWPGGKAKLALAPLEYAVVRQLAGGRSGDAGLKRWEQGGGGRERIPRLAAG
jgi:hypothetical protein